MNFIKTISALLISSLTVVTAYSQEKEVLSAEAFSEKLSHSQQAQVLDVRTRQEFSENHLKNAFNADFTEPDEFEQRVKYLDKDKPVFVYCLSGGRSAKAADYLAKQGFKQVYDMQGGIRSWMANNKPVETLGKATKKPGMTVEAFDKLVSQHTSKLVVVDFGAKWCPPCKKMAPELESLSKEMANTVAILPIDVDENHLLSKEMKVNGLPTLLLYKNGKVVWQHEGYASKEEIIAQIKKHK